MAESYDRYLVPILFEPFARNLVQRIPEGFSGQVLELACGTGVVTRALLERLGPGSHIEATDLSPKMLEYAQAKGTDSRLHFQVADAQHLPYENARFDYVVCQFGAMFFPDKALAFSEAKRVLRPGGKLIFNVWAELPEIPPFYAIELALQTLFPDDPRPMLPTPSNMADSALVIPLLEDARFEIHRMDRVALLAKGFPARNVLLGFVQGTPVSTFLREREISLEQAQERMLPKVFEVLGDPIDTTQIAIVYEAA